MERTRKNEREENKKEGGERMYLTPIQVEKLFGLSVKWLANMRWKKRGIPYKKVGNKILYKRSDIEAYLEKHTIKVIED